MKIKTFYIKTFGCQMNERDSEIMAQSLGKFGYQPGIDLYGADLVILNTCSIRAKAEQKVMSLLGYLRKAKVKNPSMKICVAGCVAQQEGGRIIKRMPHVDLVIGTQNIYNIGALIEDVKTRGKRVVTSLEDDYVIPHVLPEIAITKSNDSLMDDYIDHPVYAKFVTIMQGCNNYCTYCVVPYTRGREVSRKNNDIIDEVKVLVRSGVKEITLLGQNVNSYGRTNEVSASAKYNFSDLLRDVSQVEGLKRLRFTTSNPKDLTDELMQCFTDIKNLCPQFHLPVQSGSNAILKKMSRKYSIEQYYDHVENLQKYCPEIALTTDVIIGFPGEKDNDFDNTMRLLNDVRFHGSFSFKYSDRPGTAASTFEDKVEESVKSERLAIFQKRQDEISLSRNMEYVGEVKRILIERCEKEGCRGRTDTNHIVHLSNCSGFKGGEMVDAKIKHAGQHSLQGIVNK